ncbi:hypothetical protein Tco_1294223 [Tanacetum coccineum]
MTYLTSAPRYCARRFLTLKPTIRADLLSDDENGVDCFPKPKSFGMCHTQWTTGACKLLQGMLKALPLKVLLILNVLLQYKVLLPSIVLLQLHGIRAENQGTDDFQGTAKPHDAASIPKSPNDYTPTDVSQTSGGDERTLEKYMLYKQGSTRAQVVAPLVKHHALWVENQNLKKQKRRRKKHKKKVSSVKLGRNKDEGTLSERHNKKFNIEEKTLLMYRSGDTEKWIGDNNSNNWLNKNNVNAAARSSCFISRPRGFDAFPRLLQDFIPMDSRKRKRDVKNRCKKTLKEKESYNNLKNMPSKKPKASKFIDHLMESILSFTEITQHFRLLINFVEILHVLDRQKYITYIEIVDDYNEHIPPTRIRLMLLDDLDDPSKQGRKIGEIDQDPDISLVQHDAELQGRYRHEMEFKFDFDAAKEVSTARPFLLLMTLILLRHWCILGRVSKDKDKGNGKMDEFEPVQTKIKLQQEQERLGYEEAMRLQAKLEEEERVKADEELAQRLQADEREMYTEAEQARMLVELINKRKRYFAAQRAEERRNKPPTQAHQRTYMSNYIKHIGSYTLQQVRGYSFNEIKTLFETTMSRVNNFVPVESKVDRAVPELAAGSSKRRFTLKAPGSTGKSSELEIILCYHFLYDMLDKPPTGILRDAWNTNDKLLKLQNHIHDLTWRLYDSCEVHHVSIEKGIDIYMLVEKEYPLSRRNLTLMMVAKLLVEQDNEMSRELLRKIFMQAERPRR